MKDFSHYSSFHTLILKKNQHNLAGCTDTLCHKMFEEIPNFELYCMKTSIKHCGETLAAIFVDINLPAIVIAQFKRV